MMLSHSSARYTPPGLTSIAFGRGKNGPVAIKTPLPGQRLPASFSAPIAVPCDTVYFQGKDHCDNHTPDSDAVDSMGSTFAISHLKADLYHGTIKVDGSKVGYTFDPTGESFAGIRFDTSLTIHDACLAMAELCGSRKTLELLFGMPDPGGQRFFLDLAKVIQQNPDPKLQGNHVCGVLGYGGESVALNWEDQTALKVSQYANFTLRPHFPAFDAPVTIPPDIINGKLSYIGQAIGNTRDVTSEHVETVLGEILWQIRLARYTHRKKYRIGDLGPSQVALFEMNGKVVPRLIDFDCVAEDEAY